MPKLSHMLNYSKTLPLQQPFCEIDEGKYYNYKNILAESTYFTGTQCLSLIALTLSTRRRYFSSIKGSVFSQDEWAIVDHVFRSDPVLGPVLLDCLFILRKEKREGHQELEVWDLPL